MSLSLQIEDPPPQTAGGFHGGWIGAGFLRRPIRFILFPLFVCIFAGPALAEKIEVVFADQAGQSSLTVLTKDQVVYASLNEFSRLLSLGIRHYPENKKAILSVGARSVKITALNPFVAVDTQVIQMPVPTLEVAEEVYVPLACFLNILNPIMTRPVDYDDSARRLRIGRLLSNITGVSIEELANGCIIRISTTLPFTQTDVSAYVRNEWLYVTLVGGRLDSLSLVSDKKSGFVSRIRPFPFKDSAQIAFLLDRKVGDPEVQAGADGVAISLRSAGRRPSTALPPENGDKTRWLIDRIILDPGHGGRDPGAMGPSGLKEKEANLDIAQRLKKLLEEKGLEVLMTRDGDNYVTLQDRTRFANANGGKLFVSIHANTNPKKSIRGVSTYLLGNKKTEQALAVAEKENSVIELEESQEAYRELQNAAHILNAIAQSSYLKESEDLAQMVNSEIHVRTQIPDQGVYQAGLFVLMGAAMPRILVETAFLSNTYDERLLKTRSFRQKVAEALSNSILQFKKKYEQGL
jgi:N-acetylmuramoyl-L-alanine amidase